MAVIDNNTNGNLIILCGALHDTIEDTETTYEIILDEFGKEVADGVKALSKNYNLEKSAQFEENINRILEQPKDIWLVKMADRITNLNPPPNFWTAEKRKLYLEQSIVLYDTFKEANVFLADRLKTKIEQYKFYL
jgi:(p)ppGpp synthase/HD superfamily hydrolase